MSSRFFRFLIVASKQDLAGMNIISELKKLRLPTNAYKILLVEEDIIYVEIPPQELYNADYIIFASRHEAKDARKTLSVHFPGNWGKAEFGGEEKQLNKVSAYLLKIAFQELTEQAKNSNYQVTLEATHHGPFLQKPSIFIEIGSTKEEWQDKEAGQVIANTIINAIKKFSELDNKNPEQWKVALALGGTHYCAAFNKLELENKYALSHICSKYFLENINSEILKQAIERTEERVTCVLLDWKGLGKEKERVLKAVEEAGLEVEKV